MDPVQRDFEALRERFPEAELTRRADGAAIVRIPAFPLPPGWNAPAAEVLFVAPVGYPIARPDCFWASEGLRLASGGMPVNTRMNSDYGGMASRLWFSFHPSHWQPNKDNLLTYARLIGRRLAEPQ